MNAHAGPPNVGISETPYATELPNVQPTPIVLSPTVVPRPQLPSNASAGGTGIDEMDTTLSNGNGSEYNMGAANEPRLFAFHEVMASIRQNFHTKQTSNSFVCDMIALYLKGQKILYTEAKTYCELRLSFLMLPAILITAACSILSPILKPYEGGTTAVSALNGFTAFLLAIVNYLKLDAKAEAHRTAAYKFDKLQSALVFKSGRNLFMGSTAEDLNAIIVETEKSVREIKETDSFVLPEGVRYGFPKLYGVNIFAEIKKVQNYELELVHELWSMYNEYNTLEFDIKQLENEGKPVEETKRTRLAELLKGHKAKLNDIINIKNKFQEIDLSFESELESRRNTCWQRVFCCCGLLKT